ISSRGKPMTKITESLGSTDPAKARETRNQRIVYWERQFRVLREGPNQDDIREEQVEIYRRALKEAEAQGETDLRDGSAERTEQAARYWSNRDGAIELQARSEIEDYCKRANIGLEPGTEPYRNLGIAFIKAKIAAAVPTVWLPLPDGREIWGSDQHLPP